MLHPPSPTLSVPALRLPTRHLADNSGRITGPQAVPFFERSGLPKRTLAMVWSYADTRKTGFLTLVDFVKAMQLISIA